MSDIKKQGEDATPQYPADLLHTFLQNQSKELELKIKELELAKQREANSFEFSKFAEEVQCKNLKDERKHQRELWLMATEFAVFGVIGLTIIICLALYLRHEQFILEFVRMAFYGGCGAAAGSYYQKSKYQEVNEDIAEDEDDFPTTPPQPGSPSEPDASAP
jgi:antitoxin component of MazEF toxin-antitoxin module